MTDGDSCTSPFQSLTLSSSNSNELQRVAKTILDANVNRYRRFMDVDEGKVSPSSWKLVKTTYRTRVYLERQSRPAFTPFQASPAAEPSDLQPILCVGSTSGRLDDVMLGIVTPPTACVNDLSKAAVLSTLKRPTTADPVRSVAVKWTELDVMSKAMGLAKNHDYVYVESTGYKRLPSGERVGYHLLHSVDIKQAHHLPGRIRAQLSVCSFLRQESKNSVSVYVLLMMNPMNDRVQRVVLPHFVKTLLSTFKRAPCVDSKRATEVVDTGRRKSESLGRDDKCVTCSKRVWRLGKTAIYHSTCNVCSKNVCSSCKVVKELSFMTPELELTQRKVVFCSPCAIEENVSELSYAETAELNTPPQDMNSSTRPWSSTRDNERSLVLSR